MRLQPYKSYKSYKSYFPEDLNNEDSDAMCAFRFE
jgi:hypothetical protein